MKFVLTGDQPRARPDQAVEPPLGQHARVMDMLMEVRVRDANKHV